MSTESSLEKPKQSPWGGGVSPFGVSWGKMYMWFFLVSDAFTFSSLLIAYLTMRHRFAEIWPAADAVFVHFPFVHGHVPLAYVALMTFILIMSSVTMVMAVDAGHRRNNKAVAFWMLWTIIGGFTFLGSQHGNGTTSFTVLLKVRFRWMTSLSCRWKAILKYFSLMDLPFREMR